MRNGGHTRADLSPARPPRAAHDVDAAVTLAGQPRRRASDDRLDELIDTVGKISGQVGVVANDIGHLKEAAKTANEAAADALRTLNLVTADLNNSASGREALRRLGNHDGVLERHEAAIQDQRDFRLEVRTFVRAAKFAMSALSVVTGVLSALWTLHLLGVIP